MERHDYISLLGLALRGARLAVGADAAEEAIRGNAARLLLLSADASERTRKHAAYLSDSGHCLLLTLPDSKEALGRGLGRASVSLIALTDLGLAAAVVERLAAADPARYAEAAERLRLKSRRVQERRNKKAAPHDKANHSPGQERGPVDRAKPHGKARPYGKADSHGKAKPYGKAELHGKAKPPSKTGSHGKAKPYSGPEHKFSGRRNSRYGTRPPGGGKRAGNS